MDPLHLPIGPDAPEIVNVVVEIPKGSSNKVEFKTELNAFVVDRVLFSPLYYPTEYGFVAGTLSDDGDPLDILVFTTQPTFTGCVLVARPLGVLHMIDEEGEDTKILAVHARDPRYSGVLNLMEVGEHRMKEIEHFFRVYKDLESKPVEVTGWNDDAAKARDLIQECHLRYLREYSEDYR
jgi:inorganic pyrophosphatase